MYTQPYPSPSSNLLTLLLHQGSSGHIVNKERKKKLKESDFGRDTGKKRRLKQTVCSLCCYRKLSVKAKLQAFVLAKWKDGLN